MKKRIENIVTLIGVWCKKKLVFADPLLPFESVGEAHAHCTHLQIAQADTRPKFGKELFFLPTHPHDTDTIDVSCKQFDFLI